MLYSFFQETVESLYEMFSELLDRKIKELQNTNSPVPRKISDIKDNYLQELEGLSSSSTDSAHKCSDEQKQNQIELTPTSKRPLQATNCFQLL